MEKSLEALLWYNCTGKQPDHIQKPSSTNTLLGDTKGNNKVFSKSIALPGQRRFLKTDAHLTGLLSMYCSIPMIHRTRRREISGDTGGAEDKGRGGTGLVGQNEELQASVEAVGIPQPAC